jgi:hypothetical protein
MGFYDLIDLDFLDIIKGFAKFLMHLIGNSID